MGIVRFFLGAFGLVGTPILAIYICLLLVFDKSPHSQLGFYLAMIMQLFAYIFYAVIAIRPCRALTVFAIGFVLHFPIYFAVIYIIINGTVLDLFSLLLIFPVIIWAFYVDLLRRREKSHVIKG